MFVSFFDTYIDLLFLRVENFSFTNFFLFWTVHVQAEQNGSATLEVDSYPSATNFLNLSKTPYNQKSKNTIIDIITVQASLSVIMNLNTI